MSQNKLKDTGIAEQQKVGEQGRDGSIKQFSIQPHPTYLLSLCNWGKSSTLGSCILYYFMLRIIPNLFPTCCSRIFVTCLVLTFVCRFGMWHL